jgi:penicillin-binding protein 1A
MPLNNHQYGSGSDNGKNRRECCVRLYAKQPRHFFHQNSDINLATALGGCQTVISPLELRLRMLPFANRGIYTKPVTYTKVLDGTANCCWKTKNKAIKAMSEQTAAIMASMLKSVVDYGTGSSARFNSAYATAGKTGTTDNDVDRWFVGFTLITSPPYWVGCGYSAFHALFQR